MMSHITIDIPHVVPVQSGEQEQVKLLIPSLHVALLSAPTPPHGFDRHSLMSAHVVIT
jgi:hypothetical protein